MSTTTTSGILAEITTADEVFIGSASPIESGWLIELPDGTTFAVAHEAVISIAPIPEPTIRCVSCGCDQPFVTDDVHRFCAECDCVEICLTCHRPVAIASGCACDAADIDRGTKGDR